MCIVACLHAEPELSKGTIKKLMGIANEPYSTTTEDFANVHAFNSLRAIFSDYLLSEAVQQYNEAILMLCLSHFSSKKYCFELTAAGQCGTVR